MPMPMEQSAEQAVFLEQDRFLPIANIDRIMKNTLEPIRDVKLKRPRSKKEAKGLPKQTPYEQYEESGSDEDVD
jgi:histone H3/H4